MTRKKKETKAEEKFEEKTEETKETIEEKTEEPVQEKKAKVEKLKIDSLKKNTKEIENLIVKLANEGLTASKIGIVLRDSYGIPSVKIMDNKIGKILAAKGIKSKIPENLADLSKRAEGLKKHLEKNKQDKVAQRGLQLTEAKIKKLSAYFKKKHVLAKDWKHK